jgi:hypothetical protein
MAKKIPYKEIFGYYRKDYYPISDRESKPIDYFNPEDTDE